MHWWPRLSGLWRRRVSIATSAAGVAFLVAALQAEGLRESALTSTVVVGPTVLTATASASASLYYYVLTAFCLLLGHHAVHAGMSGRTDMVVGFWNHQFTHVPIPLAVSARKSIDPEGGLWSSVVATTGQPGDMR